MKLLYVSQNIFPFKTVFLYLAQACAMAYGRCFILGKRLPYHGCQQIQMMAQNQIRPEAFHCLPGFLQKRLFECIHHILCHLAVYGTLVRHLIRHPRYGKGQAFCPVIYRIEPGPFRKMYLVLLIDPCHHCLLMPQCSKTFYQAGKINTAPRTVGFLGCYAQYPHNPLHFSLNIQNTLNLKTGAGHTARSRHIFYVSQLPYQRQTTGSCRANIRSSVCIPISRFRLLPAYSSPAS